MRKILKGIKRIGVLALSAVIAMGTVTAIMPAKEVYADEYKLLEPVPGEEVVVKDWDFHTGLYKEVNGKIVAVGDSAYSDLVGTVLDNNTNNVNVKYGTGLIIKYTQAYKSYDDKLFDVYLKIVPGPSFYDNGVLDDKEVKIHVDDAKNGGGNIKKANDVYFISFRTGHEGYENPSGARGTDFDYEIWLRYNPSNGTDAERDAYTTYDKEASDEDKKEMFVGGSTYMAGVNGNNKSVEVARPWSSNGILYANDNLEGSNQHCWEYMKDYYYGPDNKSYSGWVSMEEKRSDSSDKFVIGYGYTENHSIKGGYTNKYANRTNKSGIAEIILGYRVRKLIFEVFPGDEGYNDPAAIRKDKDKYLEGSLVSRKTAKPYSGGTTYMPSDVFEGDWTTNANLKTGYQFTYWTAKQDVELVNEDFTPKKTIKAGERITEADMPFVKIEGDPEKPDLVFYAHTVNTLVKLNYYIENEQLDKILPKHTPGPKGTKSYDETYQRYTEPTKNGSYKKGDVVSGKDGKEYKLVGWFNESDFKTEYSFGSPLNEDKNIYAKWELVVYPNPDPTPNNGSSDSGTPTPTPTPIRVDFVSQVGIAPLPQIKNVGEKATDPGAPFDPATLQPGTVINGYRFEGWFLDPAFALPYNFDTQLTQSIVLYAKWVRVSPKTGDTTIPPIYYILGTAALAGAGLLIYRRKVKN